MADRLLYRPDEVAEMLSLGKSKVFQLMSTGEIASISCGRARRVPRESLEQWLRERVQATLVEPTARSTDPSDRGGVR
jgi:excisionase family DNA binding protein